MKMYLNIIRGQLELRKYATVKCVCSFDTISVLHYNELKNVISKNYHCFVFLEQTGVVKFDDKNEKYILTPLGIDMFNYRKMGGVFCISE